MSAELAAAQARVAEVETRRADLATRTAEARDAVSDAEKQRMVLVAKAAAGAVVTAAEIAAVDGDLRSAEASMKILEDTMPRTSAELEQARNAVGSVLRVLAVRRHAVAQLRYNEAQARLSAAAKDADAAFLEMQAASRATTQGN